MKIKIEDTKTIKSIQNEFNVLFPYLKLEVFSRYPQPGGGTAKRFLMEKQKNIYECRAVHVNGEIEIIPEMTVRELEKTFSNVYGLSIQVFRKSGMVWLETIQTDHWTLAQHNELGEFSVTELSIAK
jgi:ABC-type multidrug transport system ATPase subunit